MSRTRLLLAALLAAAFCATGPASLATAAPAADPPDARCAVEARPLGDPAAPAQPVCFVSDAELESYLADRTAASATARAAASTVLGTVYKDINEGGASLTFWGSSGCSGVTYGFASLASGWNNSISSARATNGCWVTLYTDPSYGGSRLNCIPYCASVAGWNDQVESLVFRPSGTFG